MIKVTEHTRQSVPIECPSCELNIYPGDRYRRSVLVQSDVTDKSFATSVLCLDCCTIAGESWDTTESVEKKKAESRRRNDHEVEMFNRATPVGSRVLTWVLLGHGEGRPAQTLEQARVKEHGYPCVRVRFDDGGTDHYQLTHVRVLGGV